MEYEIGDDPQGLPDRPEGDRDGGVRASFSSRKEPRFEKRARDDRHTPVEQMGEPA